MLLPRIACARRGLKKLNGSCTHRTRCTVWERGKGTMNNLRDLSCLLRCSLRLNARLQNWHLYFFSGALPEAFLGVEAWEEVLRTAAAGMATRRIRRDGNDFTLGLVWIAGTESAVGPRQAMSGRDAQSRWTSRLISMEAIR
jgi:hypothetical protein